MIFKNLTGVKYRVIDCWEKVKNVQLKIAKMDRWKISTDLLFLTSWNLFTFEEKVQHYNLYFSHETNLFLYFKDKQFFLKVIKPFIRNKQEKSFIDYWLLGDYGKIEQYNTVEFYENLNSVEKILLIYIIAQKDQGKLKGNSYF